jgi:hypothetical protein
VNVKLNVFQRFQLDPLAHVIESQTSPTSQNTGLWASVNSFNRNPESIKDLAFGIYQDENIAKLIQAIITAKDTAVQGKMSDKY